THWLTHGRAQKLFLSFHGVPARTYELGDSYRDECYTTARLLAQRLGLNEEQYIVTFQSRFGKAKWLEPYTEPTLISQAQQGLESVDIMCPGFTSDCIETIEEINDEARAAFLQAGGKDYRFIPCLNDHPAWLQALGDVAQQH